MQVRSRMKCWALLAKQEVPVLVASHQTATHHPHLHQPQGETTATAVAAEPETTVRKRTGVRGVAAAADKARVDLTLAWVAWVDSAMAARAMTGWVAAEWAWVEWGAWGAWA